MTIEEFIAARLDEDERIASAANGGGPWHAIDMAEEGIAILAGEDDGDPEAGYSYSPPRTGETLHITRYDPARELRQVEATRRLLSLYSTHRVLGPPWEDAELDTDGPDRWTGADEVFTDWLKATAAVWRKHPDYQEVWKP